MTYKNFLLVYTLFLLNSHFFVIAEGRAIIDGEKVSQIDEVLSDLTNANISSANINDLFTFLKVELHSYSLTDLKYFLEKVENLIEINTIPIYISFQELMPFPFSSEEEKKFNLNEKDQWDGEELNKSCFLLPQLQKLILERIKDAHRQRSVSAPARRKQKIMRIGISRTLSAPAFL